MKSVLRLLLLVENYLFRILCNVCCVCMCFFVFICATSILLCYWAAQLYLRDVAMERYGIGVGVQ